MGDPLPCQHQEIVEAFALTFQAAACCWATPQVINRWRSHQRTGQDGPKVGVYNHILQSRGCHICPFFLSHFHPHRQHHSVNVHIHIAACGAFAQLLSRVFTGISPLPNLTVRIVTALASTILQVFRKHGQWFSLRKVTGIR